MHIPDNYLSPSTCAVLAAVAVPVWAVSIKRIKEHIPKERIPLIGIGASFSFLMMMFNVPLPGGTTGHAVGSTLIALILGPYAACIATSIALLIQALIFGDGGILSFGANCFNMAIVMPFVGYGIYKFITTHFNTKHSNTIGIIAGSYLGINIAALCASIEFGIQPLLFTNSAGQPLYCPYPLSISIPSMLIPHLLVAGVVEVIFTLAIFSFIKKLSPDIIYSQHKANVKFTSILIGALICLTPLGLLASGTAWGEWGTDEIADYTQNGTALGFTPEGMQNGFSFNSLIPDYSVNGLNETIGYILSAVIGVALLILLFKLLGSIKGKSVNE
ncbi:MAG: cobalt transporter CbiM [Clostridium sp.]|nr:cobalt transporter CbiM [Clostridium sp.]